MNTSVRGYNISRWSGEFLQSAVESTYQLHIQPLMARHLQVALYVWAALLLVFGLPDFMALGASREFFILMVCRGLQAALLVSFAITLRKYPHLVSTGRTTAFLEVTGFALFLPVYFLRPDITSITVVVVAVMLLSMFLFVPGRLKFTLMAALTAQVMLLIAIFVNGRSTEVLVGAFFLLTLPIVIGFFGAQQLQILQRRQFAMFNEAERANRALQKEVEQRRVLEVELKHQATTDPLTGLYNRRQYEMLYRRERERCRRQNTAICLAMADLDFFKALNDEFGHDCGDIALQHVANLFAAQLREGDVVGRFGGEEFIMLLPDTKLAEAGCVIERLRTALKHTPVMLNGEPRQVTATFSVTNVWDNETDIVETLRRVDEGLYAGKRAGRNRVMMV